MKLTSACIKFFGLKKDETLKDFVEEVRALTPKDREEIKPLLEKALDIIIEPDEAKKD